MRRHRTVERDEAQADPRSSAPAPRPADLAGPLSPASVLELQRTVGNAAVSRMLAAREADPAPVQRVTDNLPPFGVDDYERVDVRLEDGTEAPAGWRSTIRETGEAEMRYSTDGTLGIRRDVATPKEFYVAPDVLARANRELELADARLVLEAGSSHLPSPVEPGGRLLVVRPRLSDAPHDPDQYANLWYEQCVEVAHRILRPLTHLVFRDPTGETATAGYRGHDDVRLRAAGAAHYFDMAEDGDHPALAAEAAQAGAPADFSGENYAKRRYTREFMDFARQVGLNRYASARVGEAYTTQSIDAGEGTAPGTDAHWAPTADGRMRRQDVRPQWPYHFAAVVADSRDRVDQITLENFTRTGTERARHEQLVEWMRAQFPHDMARHAEEAERLLRERFPADEQALRNARIGQVIGRMRAAYQGFRDQTLAEARQRFEQMRTDSGMEPPRMWYFRMVTPGTSNAFFHHETGENNPLTMVGAFMPEAITLDFNTVTNNLGDRGRANLRKFADQITGLRARGFVPVVSITAGRRSEAVSRAATRVQKVKEHLHDLVGDCRIEERFETGGDSAMTLSLNVERYDPATTAFEAGA